MAWNWYILSNKHHFDTIEQFYCPWCNYFSTRVVIIVTETGFSLRWVRPVFPEITKYFLLCFPQPDLKCISTSSNNRSNNIKSINHRISLKWNSSCLLSSLSSIKLYLMCCFNWCLWVSHCQPVTNRSNRLSLPLTHPSWIQSGPNANCWLIEWLCFLLYADCALQWFCDSVVVDRCVFLSLGLVNFFSWQFWVGVSILMPTSSSLL